MRAELVSRLESMAAIVHRFDRVVVAYSGGVDSALVLEVAHRAVGERCLGVIADSPSLTRDELEAAVALGRGRGAAVRVVQTNELAIAGYRDNDVDRCYFCKSELYGVLAAVAGEAGGATILDGFNRDDRGDWRPGRRAAAEAGVVSPLDAAGLGKADVREAARELGLANWDKPAAACLASRIPYGTPVTVESLERVASAEAVVRAEGFRQLRVRGGETRASIEVGVDELPRLMEADRLARIETALGALGYEAVSVDPLGYRRGSLNPAAAADGRAAL
ncbi:MAG: pyridinium-3,5-biscarboxylic acid mononucleotide sulfurtransferase [Chloroflexota bacterium]|jgi:uncharacterized protein|nr:pyridinium-3,5-biscarboxylic acid mononucleotide sulfurtransferase [Chloroflexota bacterium]